MYIYVYLLIPMYVRTFVYSIRMYVCMGVRMYVYIYIYIYVCVM